MVEPKQGYLYVTLIFLFVALMGTLYMQYKDDKIKR